MCGSCGDVFDADGITKLERERSQKEKWQKKTSERIEAKIKLRDCTHFDVMQNIMIVELFVVS